MKEPAARSQASPSEPSTARRSTTRLHVILGAVLLLGGFALIYAWWASYTPKRFAVVEEGRLYRSGELTPRQLEYLHEHHDIRRVVSLLAADAPQTVAERDAARAMDIEWENIPLRGDGQSTPDDRDRLRALLLDADAPPTLVHCSAGVNRTGLAVGMWRLHHDRWTYEQVLEEMRRFDFEDEPHHENLRAALRAEAAIADQPPAAKNDDGESSTPAANPAASLHPEVKKGGPP